MSPLTTNTSLCRLLRYLQCFLVHTGPAGGSRFIHWCCSVPLVKKKIKSVGARVTTATSAK